MFQVGMHVLCVKEFPPGAPYGETLPTKGTVYTVRGIAMQPHWPSAGLYLCEIVNKPQEYRAGLKELSFDEEHFRPLSSDRLSIFRQHLAPSPTDRVDA